MSVQGLEQQEKTAQEVMKDIMRSLKKQKVELKDQLAKTKFLLGDPEALKGWRNSLADESRRSALLSMLSDVERLYLTAGDSEAARIFKERIQKELSQRLTNLQANELEVKIRTERFKAETRSRIMSGMNEVKKDSAMLEAYSQARSAGGFLSGMFGRPFMRDLVTLETKAAGSKTIGKYMSKLYDSYEAGLKDVFVKGIIRGDGYKTMEENLIRATGVTAGKANLLVTTESNAIMNDTIKQVIDSNPLVKGYRFRAVLDSRTSKICQEHDGQYVPKDQAQPGVNYPPLHPRCRSTVTTVLANEDERKDTMQRYTKGGANAWIKLKPGTTYEQFKHLFDEYIMYAPNDRMSAGREVWIDVNDRRIVQRGSLQIVPNVAASASLLDGELSSQMSAAAKAVYERARLAEPKITRVLEDTAKSKGDSLAGIEFSVKTASSVEEKIARKMMKDDSLSDVQAIESMGDIVRYTYMTKHDEIVSSTEGIVNQLKQAGAQIDELDNKYLVKDSDYKGVHINATMAGQKFEVQVHSEESLAVKNTTHILYEQYRKLPEGSKERKELEAQCKEIASKLRQPKGIEKLVSYKNGQETTLDQAYAQSIFKNYSLQKARSFAVGYAELDFDVAEQITEETAQKFMDDFYANRKVEAQQFKAAHAMDIDKSNIGLTIERMKNIKSVNVPKGFNQFSPFQRYAIIELDGDKPEIVDDISKVKGLNVFRAVRDTQGLTAEAINEMTKYDDIPFEGDGIYGDGLYLTTSEEGTRKYGDAMISAKLKPDAKVIEIRALEDLMRKERNPDDPVDHAIFAAMKGYDAIKVQRGESETYFNVLRRSALWIQR